MLTYRFDELQNKDGSVKKFKAPKKHPLTYVSIRQDEHPLRVLELIDDLLRENNTNLELMVIQGDPNAFAPWACTLVRRFGKN